MEVNTKTIIQNSTPIYSTPLGIINGEAIIIVLDCVTIYFIIVRII